MFIRFFALFSLFLALNAVAEEGTTTSVNTLNSPAALPGSGRFNLSSEHWAMGPTFRAPDGDEGEGSYIYVLNYIRADLKLDQNWRLRVAPAFALNTQMKEKSNVNKFELSDPYFAVINTSVLTARQGELNLIFDGRFYPGITNETKVLNGTKRDHGNGRTWTKLILENEFLDKKLVLRNYFSWRKYLATDPTPKGISDDFLIYNIVQWRPNEIVNPYVSYNNYPNIYRDGTRDAWAKNHTLEYGIDWYVSDAVALNPYLETPLKTFKDTGFNFLARIVFF